jgi:hypothetical protein
MMTGVEWRAVSSAALTRPDFREIGPDWSLSVVLIATAVCAASVSSLLSWISYLRFCRWLVSQSKDPASLRDAAVAARAFRPSSSALAQGLARLASTLGRKGGQ